MKTNERQLFGRLGRGAFGLQVLMLVLVMLVGGTSTAWAGSWDKTNSDKGGGTYRFKGEWDTHNPSNDAYFETAQHFDLDKDHFYWDFAMRVDFRYLQSGRIETVAIDGYIYLVTADNVSHQIAYWKKEHPTGTIYLSKTDERWGYINNAGYIWGEEYASFFYTPNNQAVQDGVKRIIFKHYCYESWDPGLSFWVQYEKDLDFSGIAADKPMTKPAIEWDNGGKLTFKATGVPDRRNNSNYAAQAYNLWLYYYDNGKKSKNVTFGTADGNSVSYSNVNNGKMDMTFSYWPLTTSEAAATGCYTQPVYITYNGYVKLHASNLVPENHILSQPKVEGVLIKPFTRPVTVSLEFDKWNKKNIVKWTRQDKVKGYNGSKEVDVECRYDGKWYVVRYAKGSSANNYKLIGTLNGNVTSLQVTDTGIDYDKEYVYRVIFLPTILESKFKDNLAQLPGYNRGHNSTDLWEEKEVSTKMEVPITLTQDRTYDKAVRLIWKYSIPASGLKWTIEYKDTNGSTWLTRSDSPSIDPNTTEASIDVSGTVCDPVTYRIKTTIGGKELYSDTLSTTLPSGSYIKNVVATTGTHENTVVVTWEVENPDLVNEIYYRVLRRPIGAEGSDSWTELTDDVHGKVSRYEYTDTRPLAGTYYEYTVEAFGAKCGEQMVKSDAAVAPGFSQARGTITGHISFGSGTAVQGVRVNLIKSSADQESDQVQYLSRYIDGPGKGLQWKAGSEEYSKLFSGSQVVTTQLWARPVSDGAAQMSLLSLPGAIELGMKRIGDTSGYELQLPDENWMFISSAADWKDFANAVNGGQTGLNAIMTADVDISAAQVMAGNSSDHAYSGTFDGNGHTLTVNYNTTEQYTAPFLCAAGATIKNLRVAGTLTSKAKFVAGVIGSCASGTNTITNCRVSATIDSSVSGDATNGGFVAVNAGSSTLNISNCLFDGKFTGSNATSIGGFVGWGASKVNIQNSLVAPSVITIKADASATFARMSNYNNMTLTNAYYTKAIGTIVQGTSAEGMDDSTLLTKLGTNWQIVNNQLLVKMASVASPSLPRKAYTVTTVDKHAGTSSDATAVYQLYAVDLSTNTPKVTEFPALTFSGRDFTHVAAVYDGAKKWEFYVGTDSLRTDSLVAVGTQWTPRETVMSVGGSGPYSGSTYKGHVDDIRLWARALKPAEVESNYTRILGGTEDGLKLYWPLDEGENVHQYAFDIACQDGIYQLNHPEVGPNAVPRKEVPQHLKLYGMTDSEGDYIIKGVPFQQGGTNYKIAPELGIHNFSPATRTMFVSPTSLTANNIDFEDVSSFPMDGYVRYAGTNIPVEGAFLYVDGELQTKNGKAVQTDADGYYEMSVPIGKHYVTAENDGHKMVAGGRFPQGDELYDFDAAVTYDFADSTLVNFVGRVDGATRNDTLAVGFGASKNLIGKARITLKLNNDSRLFNYYNDHAGTQERAFESDTTAINSRSWAGAGSGDAKYIYIETDPQTGEFSAKLPPLKYTVKSIEIPKNPDIEFTTLPQIDLTNVRKEMKDSIRVATESGDTITQYYTYNTKMVKTYFAEPQLIVSQKDCEGFGEQEMLNYAVSTTETADIKDIWTKQADGTIKYNYDFPVFARNKEYEFDVRGFEVYTNYDSGTAVNDSVALNGLVVTIANEMSNIQDVVAKVIDKSQTNLKDGDIYGLKRTQLRLDKDGRNGITFTTGAPNVTAPYTRHFSMSFERNKRTYAGQSFDGIVLGELTNGDNFVTQGPDHVDMVLRDPPGAKGKVTWKTGTSYTKIHNDVNGAYFDESVTADLLWGTAMSTAVGMGVAIISSSSAHQALTVGQQGSYTWQWEDDSTFVYTNAESISSSTGAKYVGAKGDIFIGKSHNYIVGTCRKLGFHREASGIVLGLKEAVSINDSIATDFIFSAREVEETMIPKVIETRNALLEYMDEAAAKAYQNTTDQNIYLTWLKPNDPNYGEEGTYVCKPGTKKSQDMVLHYNESVKNWKARLAENEKDKVEAMEARDKYLKENRSFDGGSSYTYSERRDSIYNSTYKTSTKVGGTTSFKTNIFINYAASFGMNLDVKADAGYVGSSVVGDSLDNKKTYAEFEYELNDGNQGTDFSVDIYRSPRGWGDIFVLRGGQSYNPYEGKVYAEYYEPEKKHVISYGTEQMEQPVIRISTDGKIGASSATLNDVPAGGTGEFTLHLTNGTTTNSMAKFTYELDVAETYNPNGLEVLMDGVPANGRGIYIPAGETVTKTITVRQTDQSVLDYEGIVLWFCSSYQPFSIYDECKLNVHFVPSSSPIDLTIQEPVLNTDNKDGMLNLKLSNFNRQFKNMKNVGVQYRFAGNTQWTDLYTWWVNKADTIGKDTLSNNLLPEMGDIRYAVNMKNNLAYPEGDYEFRAFTTTPYGNDDVQVYSDIITVTKDMTRPRNLYTPAPADGILNYGDQLAIEFNEDIVPGYVGADNVIVTAKLNSQKVNHDVAYEIVPYGNMPRTVNPVFLKGSFSMDFWLNWHQAGTILHQGEGTDNFALAVDDEGHVKVTIAKASFVSTKTVPKDEWTFFALSYNADKMMFDILAQYGETTVNLFENQPVTDQNVQVVNYATDNHLYLGKIWADIHGLSLYNIRLDVNEAAATKYQAKDNYVYGLANYWPMDEGHGNVAADTRHTHDFTVDDSWVLKNKNYSLRIDNKDGAQADITRITTGQGDSYAIEMWYHNNGDKDEVVFETATPTVEGDLLARESKLRLRLDSLKNIVLDYGKKSQIVASHVDFPNLTNWHHYALNVVRGQAASFYLDGQRTAVISEADVPPIEGTRLVVGKNNTELAFADELRIWHATLSERRLLSNMYNTIDTTDVYSRGLVAYYPFEKTGEVNGVTTKVATLENMVPNLKTGDAKELDYHANALFENTPPLKNAPEETRLIASPVASERKVVINLTGAGISLRDIEGTTLNVTVDQIHDLHGNTSLPIRWTAYVQQNTLKWTRDSVNVFKQYGDDYTFDVDIENKSGNTEYYTLYNMPQWLTLVDSERTDDVQALKTKTLRFQVNPLVAVGNYDVTIGLQGNNAILEPLRIVMKVSGEKPNWTVDPTEYLHQMTIVGQVYLNGILMENEESMVAAFIGGECRGVASPKKVRGAAYVTMNIYGNDDKEHDQQKAVSFRIWDAQRGVAYTNAHLSEGNVKVYDNPKVEIKWTSNGEVDNTVQRYFALRILDHDGDVAKNWFSAAEANTVTYPYGYTLEIRCSETNSTYAFTLNKNMTIVCSLDQRFQWSDPESTAKIESSSDVEWHYGASVVFQQDAMIGNFNQPAIWTKSDDVEQQIPLHQNWNWIAFGVEPESPYLDRVFSDLADWQLLVKSHTAVNDYNGAEWGYGTLTTPKVNEMYKLRVTRLPSTPADASVPTVMTVSGRQPVASSGADDAAKLAVTLEQGWNWIAYTPLTTMTIDEALAAASPQPGDIVKSQTAVAIYDQNGWEGTLTALEGGRGYMYYSLDGTDKSFLYPTTTVAQAHAMSLRAPRRAPDALRIFTPVSPTFYPNNMTMVVQLRDGETVVDTCEVAAFIGDECRGAVRANTKGLYYLVIAGEGAGQPMVLRTCIDGEIIDIDNTQTFVSDANIGTSWEPYVIDLKNVLSGISSIVTDDSDDSDWWTLQGFKIGRKPTQPGVYIHHGQKVTIKRMK